MEDTKSIFSISNYTPEEASDAIDNAPSINVDPQTYLENITLSKEINTQLSVPGETDRGTARVFENDPIKASIFKPDNDKYSKSAGFFTQNVNNFKLNQLRHNVREKFGDSLKLTGSLSNEEYNDYLNYQDEMNKLQRTLGTNAEITSLDYGGGLAAGIIPTTIDSFMAIAREPLATGLAASPAIATGATASAATLNPVPLAIGTFTGIVGPGMRVASAIDTYKQTAFEVRKDIFEMNVDGIAQVPLNTTNNIAFGTALVVAAIDSVPFGRQLKAGKELGKAAIKGTFKEALGVNIKQTVRKGMLSMMGKEVAMTTAEKGVWNIIKSVGRESATEAGTEGIQEVIQGLSTTMAETFNEEGETSITNAIGKLGADYALEVEHLTQTGSLPEGSKIKNLVTSSATGFGAGGATVAGVAGTTRVFGAAGNAVQAKVRERRAAKPTVENVELKSAIKTKSEALAKVADGARKITNSIRNLEIVTALEQSTEVTKDTNAKKLQPELHEQAIANQIEEAGIDGMWIDPDKLREWAEGDESKQRVLQRLEGEFADEFNQNASFKIGPQLVVNLQQNFPDSVRALMVIEPESMTVKQYEKHAADLQRRQDALLKNAQINIDNAKDSNLRTVEDIQETIEMIDGDIKAAKETKDSERLVALTREKARLEAMMPTVPFRRDLQTMDQSFETSYDMQKNTEARGIQIDPDMTDAEIAGVLKNQETAQAFLNRLNNDLVADNAEKNQELYNRIDALMDTLPSETVDIDVEKEMIDADIPQDSITQAFLSEPAMPAELEAVLPEGERNELNKLHSEAKIEFVAGIQDAALNEREQMVNLETEIALSVEREAIAIKLKDDPELQVVDNFVKSASYDVETAKALGIERKKGSRLPALQIDVESLTEEQKLKYLNNEKLKERKVFAKKGGIKIDEAVMLTGAKDANSMLQILSTKLTTNEAIDVQVKLREEMLSNHVDTNTDIDQTSVIKSIEKRDNFYKAMKGHLQTKNWSTLFKAVKRVAFSTKTHDVQKINATITIYNTKNSDVSVSAYRKGEYNARKKAIDAMKKGDMQSAFDHFTVAQHNLEMQKAALKAIDMNKRNVKKMAKFFTSPVLKEFQKAGKAYTDALNEFMKNFNLSPYMGDVTVKEEAFQKLTEFINNAAGPNAAIPTGLLQNIDNRLGWKSMTVGEFNYVTNVLGSLYKSAKEHNKLKLDEANGVAALGTSLIEDMFELQALEHPERNTKKLDIEVRESTGNLTAFEKVANIIDKFNVLTLNNIEYAALNFDQGKTDGLMHTLVWDQIMGRGKFEGAYGLDRKQEILATVNNSHSELIERYGGKVKFIELGTKDVYVPEFVGIKHLGDGKGNIKMIDLVMMTLHRGNKSNFEALSRYGFDLETFDSVINKHLTHKEMEYVQGIWDIMKSFEKRTIALEKLDGRDVRMIQAQPFDFQGKTYSGGWMHIEASSLDVEKKSQENILKELYKTDIDYENEKDFVRAMTDQGYVKQRLGSDALVSLHAGNIAYTIDMIANDLTMRIPIRETYKIMNNEKIGESIKSVLGHNTYNDTKKSILGLTLSSEARGLKHRMESDRLFDSFFSKLENAHAIAVLAGNITSTMVQFTSLGVVLEKMGPSALPHIQKAVALTSSKDKKAVTEFALTLDPTIENGLRNVESHFTGGILPDLPTKGNSKFTKLTKLGSEWLVQKTMKPIAGADTLMKKTIAIASYSQFMAGEAPGFNMDKISKMSPNERRKAAIKYATDISSQVLTQSSDAHQADVQKSSLGRRFARFYNDLRQQMNMRLLANKQLKWDLREASKAVKEGADVVQIMDSVDGLAGKALWMAITTIGAAAFEAFVRGQLLDDRDEKEKITDILVDSIFARFGLNRPIIRDVKFSVERYKSNKGFDLSVPALSAAKTLGEAGMGTYTVLSETLAGAEAYSVYLDLTYSQKKALRDSVGLLGRLPMNEVGRISSALDNPDNPYVPVEGAVVKVMTMMVNKLNQIKEDLIEKKEDLSPEDAKGVDDAIEQIESALNMVQPTENVVVSPDGIEIPITADGFPTDGEHEFTDVNENVLAVIRKIENPTGKWDANPGTTSAFGHYQITAGTWKSIVEQAPKALGLTEKGLYEKDGKQAELGIMWFIQDNVKVMKNLGLDNPTLEDIYGAHHFGAAKWVKVLKANSDTPKSFMGNSAIKANPWMQGKDVKTVSDVIAKVHRLTYLGVKRAEEEGYFVDKLELGLR